MNNKKVDHLAFKKVYNIKNNPEYIIDLKRSVKN